MQAPAIRDFETHERFRATARRLSLDPDSVWVGGYVEKGWHHSRHVFECAGLALAGASVLEFGCNVGATSILLATLGAVVTGVDVNRDYVELARLNAASYGLAHAIGLLHVPDTRRLPFADEHFDVVICSSVLEYVPHDTLGAVQRELDRVLKHGGTSLIQGTSNRLWPREVHSGRWFVNYLPRAVDRLPAADLPRGVFPWQMRRGFGPAYSDAGLLDRGTGYLEARRRMGVSAARRMLLRTAIRALAPLRLSVGLLTPTICLQMRKDGGIAPGAARIHCTRGRALRALLRAPPACPLA